MPAFGFFSLVLFFPAFRKLSPSLPLPFNSSFCLENSQSPRRQENTLHPQYHSPSETDQLPSSPPPASHSRLFFSSNFISDLHFSDDPPLRRSRITHSPNLHFPLLPPGDFVKALFLILADFHAPAFERIFDVAIL